MREYRQALRAAIGELPAAAGRTVIGCYASADARRCDVENLLLYNVGLSAFANLQVCEIVLMRSTDPTAGRAGVAGAGPALQDPSSTSAACGPSASTPSSTA